MNAPTHISETAHTHEIASNNTHQNLSLQTQPMHSEAPVFVWDADMVLGHADLDGVHHEMGDLLNRLAMAEPDELLEVLDECIAHTRAHFDLEEGWMARLSFPAAGCHISEHNQVFGVMKQVRDCVAEGDVQYAYVLAKELGAWLKIHASSMDYALTHFIESTHANLNATEAQTTPAQNKPHTGCGC